MPSIWDDNGHLQYLTPACKNCDVWMDGTKEDDWGVGCGTHVPIAWCPHFAAMEKEEEEKREKGTEN